MQNTKHFFIPTLFLFLSACGFSRDVYEGIQHPQTSSVEVSFQENAIPDDCSAFAHLFMNTAMNTSGKDIANAMRTEAMDKGTDLILIGMARQAVGEELEENRFDYYGPEYSYNFNRTWLGWKFGFNEWNDADELIGVGTDAWDNSTMNFDNTLLIQAVFLRCGD